MIDCVCATASCWRSFDRWPPAMWPVSCASTPMISFGVFESISAPAFTKMRRPSMTKALNARSLISVTWMFCCARPAVLRIGCGVFAHQLLDLGVADERNAARQARACGGNGAKKRHRRDRQRRDQRQRAGCWRPPPHPDRSSANAHICYGSRAQMFGQTSSRPRQGQRDRDHVWLRDLPGVGRKDRPNAAAWGQSVNAPSNGGGARGHDARFRTAAARAIGPQRCSGLHGDGRDGGGGRIEAAGGRVIHMEVGQPAAGAPAPAIAAARAALGSGPLGYTEIARHSVAARADRAALCGYLWP